MGIQGAKSLLEREKVRELYQQMQTSREILQAQLQEIKTHSADLAKLIEQVLPSVVSVHAINWDTSENFASGSGFFVAPDIIVTNYRTVADVVEEDSYFEEDESEQVLAVTHQGELRLAEVVFTGNADEDLALLFISDFVIDSETGEERESPQEYPSLELAFDPQLGEPVIAVGHPMGHFTSTISHGTISVLPEADRYEGNGEKEEDFAEVKVLQTDAVINLGNSGGPLINRTGQVVGVNAWGWEEGANINVAITSESLDEFLAEFEESFDEETDNME